MAIQTITLPVPETIYTRLVQTAEATGRPLHEVIVRSLQVGSPPNWADVPPEFQTSVAALDRYDDEALWRVARSFKTAEEMKRYQELLDRKADGLLTETEQHELDRLRFEADRFMLRKAQAAALLRWRGHDIPPVATLAQSS